MQQELEFGIGLLNGQSTQGFTFSNSNPSVFNPTVSTPSNSFLAQVIDQHTAQNYFANSNDQLARSNDAEIVANLDAAVAANQEAISTNNTRIAALNGVTDAYTKQAEAQSTLVAANQAATKSQTAADNAQTVSNMLAALPENPTPQQIATVNQAIDENPEVFGDQAAAIKSNLSANPPNLDAARSSASSVASSAATTAAADQRAATQAKTNADNATAAVDGAKKAAVNAGVPESDVASASAASSATSKLQTENAALAADNANAANAKKYIEDRRTAANEAAKAEDDRVRGEKDRRYNIGALTPNTSTAELYDLRNINYTNFRGSKGSSADSETVGADGTKTTTTTYRSGASKSYYMHIDYVFSNDLNMSSIDEKYKQNIQPIILNEFQPNEMIQINDVIGGTLKGLDKVLALGLSVAGDFMKPGTKFITNILIDKVSKDPKSLYSTNRKNNSSPELKDLIFDPVLKVRNMFRGGKWLNTYELPFFNNNFLEANWSNKWSGYGITGDFGEEVGKVIQDKFAIDYPSRPKFSVNMSDAGRSPFDIEFYLINKDIESLKKNFKFLTAFYAGTSWMNLQGGFVRPPNVYNVICPGRFEIPWAAVDSTITFEGKLRKMSKEKLGSEFAEIKLIESQMYWPDAWKMKIHIRDLSVNNFNMYADYYQHGFDANYYTSLETDMTETLITSTMSTFGVDQVLDNMVADENRRRGKKMTAAEEAQYRADNRERARQEAQRLAQTKINEIKNTGTQAASQLLEVDFQGAIKTLRGKTQSTRDQNFNLGVDNAQSPQSLHLTNRQDAIAARDAAIAADKRQVDRRIAELQEKYDRIYTSDPERAAQLASDMEALRASHQQYSANLKTLINDSTSETMDNHEITNQFLNAVSERGTISAQFRVHRDAAGVTQRLIDNGQDLAEYNQAALVNINAYGETNGVHALKRTYTKVVTTGENGQSLNHYITLREGAAEYSYWTPPSLTRYENGEEYVYIYDGGNTQNMDARGDIYNEKKYFKHRVGHEAISMGKLE